MSKRIDVSVKGRPKSSVYEVQFPNRALDFDYSRNPKIPWSDEERESLHAEITEIALDNFPEIEEILIKYNR